ncbi:OmpP1/FadL family transporter [Marinifilum flexuosum]|uniref:Long-chain fatty acid transport protein n=1 Tax=Marinifilum flexuosum TaxID=1117708 RepID=A0A419WXJ1_9BACT|nr:OmpP1/FadL family transporter [Marinifilum flexuosum]RKE00174.1 long-chain fatty acid transport protein [Marinifilum flexuosum]
MIKRICLAIAIIAMAYNVKAEGFAVNLQGVKQTGMGHVGTALNFDASSMQWNPGALATLDSKYSFSLGGFGTLTKAEYTGLNGTESTDNPTNTPFYFYGSMKVSDKFAVGLGVYTPFGNTMDWGETWSGRYLIQDISMKSIYIQPTISYKVNDWLSVGAGLNIVYGDVELNKAIPVFHPVNGSFLGDGKVNISGNNIQYGYNLGVFLQPNDKLNIGISYRSQIDVKLEYSDADANFSLLADALPDGGVAAELPLPSSLNLGVAYQINEKWLVSADVNFIKWSEYESLDFDFENPAVPDSQSKRDWDNTMTWRFGTRYTASEKLDLYAGLYFDKTPTNTMFYSPETPGADKVGVSLGFSYKLTDKLSLDATVLYNEGEKVTAAETNPTSQAIYQNPQGFTGEYKYRAWLPGVGITYNF